MPAATIEQMADRVAALMEQRLHVRGASLSEKLARGGRALPRKVRGEAALLAEAARNSANPRLLRQLDLARMTRAHDTCLRHLQGLNRAARLRGALVDLAGSIAARLLAVVLLVLAVMWWRSLI